MTGAGAGIGLAAVRAFLDAGAAGVAMLYNTKDSTIKLGQELEAEFQGRTKIRAYKCSVNDSNMVADVVAQVIADFGRLDVFVNQSLLPST